MNIFRSDKAPYILGLLVTVISWHVSQIGNEVTKTQAVTYRLDINPKSGEVVALVRNVSRTKPLVRATFSIACAGGVNCLAPLRPPTRGEDPVYGEVRPVAPHATAADVVEGGNEPYAVSVVNSLAPGGQYEILAQHARRDVPLEFFFIPDQGRPLDILIYDSKSITGFLVENYFRMLIVSLLLLSGLLIASIAVSVRPVAPDDSSGEGKGGS